MPTKLGTTFACGHSGSAKPFSPQTKSRKDRHTPENVEGLPVHQLRVRLCMHVTFLRSEARSDGQREQVQGGRERGMCVLRSVLVSVRLGLSHCVATSGTPGLSL